MPSVYEPSNFSGRVNYAADCISNNRCMGTRSFDTCFEMNDGDAVVTALIRRSENNPKLKAGIMRGGATWYDDLKKTAERYAKVPTSKLAVLAAHFRTNWDAAQAYAASFSAAAAVTPEPAELILS